MSWNGLKKSVGRTTTNLMMKTGHVERTTDREYEVEERRYRTLEAASLRLQKEAKGYLDSLRAMTASQMRIAETIDAFYGDSGATDGVSRSYKQAVEDLDAETVKALDGPYRCVSQDPRLLDTVFDEDAGIYNYDVVNEIENELNFKAGNRRNYTRDVYSRQVRKEDKLIEFCYRTTVLEPINRFCAYFPDINECIKKRNHKMLDYDAMRSKVKKLVEKPDKDPSKLPRTEKETEMVMSASEFFRTSHLFENDVPPALHDDLSFPSPPKALDGLKHQKKYARIQDADEEATKESIGDEQNYARMQADEEAAKESVGIRRSSSVMNRMARASSMLKTTLLTVADVALGSPIEADTRSPPGWEEHFPAMKSPVFTKTSTSANRHSGHFDTLPVLREASKDTIELMPMTPSRHSHLSPNMQRVLASPNRSSSMPMGVFRESKAVTPLQLFTPGNRISVSPSSRTSKDTQRSVSTHSRKPSSSHKASLESTRPLLGRNTSSSRKEIAEKENRKRPSTRANLPTPFFEPSELEDIMAPFRQKFAEEQADLMQQAKAAYEQLNTQLTDELPQLIDLRVPYLDPSFEALVKIQLRFCAEAYSRMAQVQQYLDASTRDQYASGDLDARVEDVLGQIRELSIAGTV